MNLLKKKVLPGYGLDKEYKVVDGSTPAMLAELKRAYAKKEPIAVLLWTPHWAYSKYDLTKLKDPKGLFGKGDTIRTVTSKAFIKKHAVPAYFALTFAISWGGFLIMVGPGGLANTSVDPTYPYQFHNVPFGGTLPILVNHQRAYDSGGRYYRVLVDNAPRLDLGTDPPSQLGPHPGDLLQVNRGTQVWILFGGNQERGLGEVQLRLRRLQQARKRVACVGRRHRLIV